MKSLGQRRKTPYNIAFVKARQMKLGCAEIYKSAVVQIPGGQTLKSVPSQML
jgi:hypothetical protein